MGILWLNIYVIVVVKALLNFKGFEGQQTPVNTSRFLGRLFRITFPQRIFFPRGARPLSVSNLSSEEEEAGQARED